MADYNGSSMGLAVILGELRAESRHTIAALERQNEILLDLTDHVSELPSKIATAISTQQKSASRIKTPESDTRSVLQAIPPILKAAVPILTIIGLMTGGISWADIPMIVGLGGP